MVHQEMVKRQQLMRLLTTTLSIQLFVCSRGDTTGSPSSLSYFGVGVIEEVRVQRDGGFGFVRYNTHIETSLAIWMGNTQSILCGKPIMCSWGSKPTPPGTSSNPLLLSAAAPLPSLSATDLRACERQLAMSKMGGVHALMHPQGQHPFKQATMRMGCH